MNAPNHMADDEGTSVAAFVESSSGSCCPCSKYTAKYIRTCICKQQGVRCSSCGPLLLGRCSNQPPHDANEASELPHSRVSDSGSSPSDPDESMAPVSLPCGESMSSVEIGRPIVFETAASTLPLARYCSSSVTNSLAREGPLVTLEGSITATEPSLGGK